MEGGNGRVVFCFVLFCFSKTAVTGSAERGWMAFLWRMDGWMDTRSDLI